MRLAFVGDIMPGGVLPYQTKYVENEIKDLLYCFDCRIGTLECAMGDNLSYDSIKMKGRKNIIYSPTREIYRLKELGVDVVSLANNHVYDLGEKGLETTIELLDKIGIKHCGAGMNIDDASKPAIVELNGKSIAFLAYCQYGSVYLGYVKIATSQDSGVCPLDIDKCVEDIKIAKSLYDYVIVMPHWGVEYQYLPTPECVRYARQMIDAGADGIFASHTHQIQPMIWYKSKPIAFSMGNFLFPDFYMTPPRPIWYPEDSTNLLSLPKFYCYPKVVETPCLQVWNHLSRIGMLVDCRLSEDINASYELVYCNDENILNIYSHQRSVKLRFLWMSSMIKFKGYDMLYKVYQSRYNVLRRGFHLIRKIVRI